MPNFFEAGQLSSAYGIKGWLKVHSYTEPTINLFRYQPWQLETRDGLKPVDLLEWRPHGKIFVVQVQGIENRNQAETLCPATIVVDKSLLPALEKHEHYWHELEGCRVLSNYRGVVRDLGVVKRIIETGANDVLEVVGDKSSLDRRERLIPYLPDRFIQEVDLTNTTIFVDWDPDF
ncbi:MAG: 16S rRNA processing protein RimM [Cellvibrionaceae bacterium]|jgi:16S rRNA processing protein RimM